MRKTIGRIDNQEKQIQNLIESMRKSQKAIDILQQYQASHISMLYSLQTYQTAMQTRLLKTTMSILNTLQLINTQTGKVVNGLQQLTRGELSADLIPPGKLQKTLENIDKQLMMNNLPFQIPISSLKYYYGTKLIGFAYKNSLSIMIRIPLRYGGGIWLQIQTCFRFSFGGIATFLRESATTTANFVLSDSDNSQPKWCQFQYFS